MFGNKVTVNHQESVMLVKKDDSGDINQRMHGSKCVRGQEWLTQRRRSCEEKDERLHMALRTLAFQELSRGRPVSTHKMTPESIRMTEEQISEKESQSSYSWLLSVSGL